MGVEIWSKLRKNEPIGNRDLFPLITRLAVPTLKPRPERQICYNCDYPNTL